MPTIVGALAVELGLDTAQFESSLKNLPGMTRTHFNAMSSEMKRTSREGAESMRLIDEAFGIHISRPIARILAQEFPQFAKGLQSLLGAGVALGVAAAAFDFIAKGYERITKAIEDAKKKNEEFIQSQHNLVMALNEESTKTANALDTIKQKLAELSGDKQGALAAQLRIISRTDAEEAVHAIDAISDAYSRNAKAAMEAMALWNRFWTMVGSVTTSPLDLQTDQVIKKNTEIKNSFDEITTTKGIKEGAAFLTDELQKQQKLLDGMKKNQLSGFDTGLAKLIPELDVYVAKHGAVTKETVIQEDSLVRSLQKQLEITKQLIQVDEGRKKAATAQSAATPDIGEKMIEKLKADTEAQLALAAATGKTATEQRLQVAAGEADQIIARIQEEAHGRLTKAMREELGTVHALTAERLVAKDAVATNQNLENQIDAVHRQIDANKQLAAAYLEGGSAIENAKIDQRLAAQIQEANKLRAEYEGLKKAADDYAESAKKLGGAAGPKPGLDISPERIAQVKVGVDAADSKVAQLRAQALAEDQAKYQVEINQTSAAISGEKPLLDALNQAYTENAESVRRAQNALALFHWEQAHPGATPQQIQAISAQLDQQSIIAQRSADSQLAARYSIARGYDDEIKRLERAREVLQQYGQDTLAIDAAIYEERQRAIKQWDDVALKVGDFGQKFQAVMNEVALKGEEASQKMAQAWLGAITSVNDELAKMLTGQKFDFKHIVIQLAQEQTKGELDKAEGWLAQQFGIKIPGLEGKPDGSPDKPLNVRLVSGVAQGNAAKGVVGAAGGVISHAAGVPAVLKNLFGSVSGTANSPDGSSSNPFYVVSATPGGTPIEKSGVAGSVAAELLNGPDKGQASPGASQGAPGNQNSEVQLATQLLSSFGGFLATGGPARSGTSYMVGEKGPELFRPSSTGEVVPNSQLNWTFDPHAGYAKSYEAYERSLHRGASDNSFWMSLALLGGKSLLPKFIDLFHHRPTADSTTTDAGRSVQTPGNVGFGIGALDGFRASGGPVARGNTYMVGERGPEIFHAPLDGHIVPNHMLTGFMADGGDVFSGRSYVVGERGKEAYNIPGVGGVSNVSSRGGDVYHGDVYHGPVLNQTIKAAPGTDLFNLTDEQKLKRSLGKR